MCNAVKLWRSTVYSLPYLMYHPVRVHCSEAVKKRCSSEMSSINTDMRLLTEKMKKLRGCMSLLMVNAATVSVLLPASIKAYITIVIWLWYEYDTRMHSTTTEVIEIMICVRFDCDTTMTRLRRKIDVFIFCLLRITSNGSIHTQYIVVGS